MANACNANTWGIEAGEPEVQTQGWRDSWVSKALAHKLPITDIKCMCTWNPNTEEADTGGPLGLDVREFCQTGTLQEERNRERHLCQLHLHTYTTEHTFTHTWICTQVHCPAVQVQGKTFVATVKKVGPGYMRIYQKRKRTKFGTDNLHRAPENPK